MKKTIEEYAAEGWTARKKVVTGREYIIVRLGGKDRSLGPSSDELWKRCQKLGMVKAKITPEDFLNIQNILAKTNQEVTALRQELEKLKTKHEKTETDPKSEELLRWKISNCIYSKCYLKQNVFCSKYYWDIKPSNIIKRFPNVTFKRSAMDFDWANRKWRFIPHSDICGLCNPIDELFSNFNKETLNLLQSRVKLNKDDIAKIHIFQQYLTDTAKRRVRTDHPQGHCLHLGEDGYCTYWYYSARNWNRDQKQDKQGKWRDNVRSQPIICVACPNYEKPPKT